MLFTFKRRTLAQQGEDRAAKYLKRQGYRILERNARLGRYEIDIIAREGDTVAFVEVKTRRSGAPVDPVESVNFHKRRHIRRGASTWIQQHDDGVTYYRFDIVTIVWPERSDPIIHLYRNAFGAAE